LEEKLRKNKSRKEKKKLPKNCGDGKKGEDVLS
jgi:hypothetical protein